MRLSEMRHLFLLSLCVLVGCDALGGSERPPLVVEAFFVTGEPLPTVRVTRAAALFGGQPEPVPDADVMLDAGGRMLRLVYASGVYTAVESDTVAVGARYRLTVASEGDVAIATALAPPRIRLSDLRLTPSDTTVRAVLLDTLRFDTTATGARQELVYPVAVDARWRPTSEGGQWIRVSVRPSQTVGSSLVSFFFPREAVAREATFVRGPEARWTGGYAVPVDLASGGRPAHRVTVAVVRSDESYARWVASADAPDRREPVGNVSGGRGLVVGLSLDSLSVLLPALHAPPPP
jgi:hypothetical protein